MPLRTASKAAPVPSDRGLWQNAGSYESVSEFFDFMRFRSIRITAGLGA